MEEATQSKLRTDSNEVENYFQLQNVKIKEEVVSDDEPTDDLQPISQVYLQEYKIKSEVVDSTTLASVEQREDKNGDTRTYYSCSLCTMKDFILGGYKKHLAIFHHLTNEEILKYVPESYPCKHCHFEFETPSLLQKHEGSHDLPYECDMCGKKFSQETFLRAHKLLLCKPIVSCPHCDKKFKYKKYLQDHIKSMHRVNVYKCDQCEKIFKRKYHLLQHTKYTHQTPRYYSWKCDDCGKSYKVKCNLKNHIINVHVHNNESTKYVCSYCSVKFKFNASLKRHMRTKHNIGVPIESNKSSRKPRNRPKSSNDPNPEGVSKPGVSKPEVSKPGLSKLGASEPVGQLLELHNQHLKIKEEILEDDGSDEIQPISEVYLPEFPEVNIKTEVSLDSTSTDAVQTTTENVTIKTEITNDEMDLSSLEESTEEAHSEGQSSNIVLEDNTTNESSTSKQGQVEQPEDKNDGTKTYYSCSICTMKNFLLEGYKNHLVISHHLAKEEIWNYVPISYQCKYCPLRFETPSLLQRHERSHTLPYQCDRCDKKFSEESFLRGHKMFLCKPILPCPHCDMKFIYKVRLKDHMQSMHSVDVYKCDQCEKIFKRKHDLLQHTKYTHHTPRYYSWKCDECGKSFTAKCSLKKHIINVHQHNNESTKYVCSYCSVKFKVNASLKRHMRIKHNIDVPIESNKSSRKPRNRPKSSNDPNPEGVSEPGVSKPGVFKPGVSEPVGQLLELQNQHLKIKEEILEDDGTDAIQPISEVYLPEFPEVNIKTKVSLDSTSTVEQPEDKNDGTKTYYSCSLCTMKNFLLERYKRHLVISHHLAKEEIWNYVPISYQCKYCQLRFETTSLLQRHERSHTLPYECDRCYKKFSEESFLRGHKMFLCKPILPCPHCDMKFIYKKYLQDHIKSMHTVDVYKCDQCEKVFKHKYHLLRHTKYTHQTPRYYSWKCDECGKSFKVKCNLKKHIINVHVHNNESTKYVCSYCSVKFKFNASLKRHMRTKHNIGVPIESNKSSRKPRNHPKSSNDPNPEGVSEPGVYKPGVSKPGVSKPGVSEPVGQFLELQNQHLKIKEEILEDDGSDEIQPISEVNLPEFPEVNIKTDVSLDSTSTDAVQTATENVTIKTEITIDEMDLSTLEESTDSEGQSANLVLDDNTTNESSTSKQGQVKQVEDGHEAKTPIYSCSLCEYNSIRLQSFNTHLSKKHRLSKEEILKYIPEFYECKYCQRQFKTPFKLQEHEGSHTLPFKCDICGKRYGFKNNLKEHKLIHFEARVPCPHCGITLKSNRILKMHMKAKHSQSDPCYKCDQCDRTYKYKSTLMQHTKTSHSSVVS